MTIKRKTQLNLSGSHRNLDADFVHIGSTLFVTGSSQFTGSVNVDDVLSASGDLSTAGALFVQGATQLTGAVNLASTLSASGQISTAAGLRVGAASQLTGALNVQGGISGSQNITAAGTISGSTGRFTYLSGALSASSTGLPFLVAGSNITANWSDTNLNWEITGSGGGGTPAGDDRTVQFNNNGAFAGDVDLQFYSNSLGNIGANTLAFPSGNVGVLSGSNIDNQAYTLVLSGAAASIPNEFGGPFPGVFDPAIVVLTPVLMSQSLMLFDGYHDPLGFGDPDINVPGGGLVLANNARFTIYSGSWNPFPSNEGGKDPVVSIYNGNQGGTIDLVGQLQVLSSSIDQENIFRVSPGPSNVGVKLKSVGTANFVSGAVTLTNGSNFTVFSGSGGFGQFYVAPSFTSGKVDASLNGAMTITSGSLYVNSGSSSDSSFRIEPSATAAQVNVIFDSIGSIEGVPFRGINIRPLYSSMTTSDSAGTIMSGSLLSFNDEGPNTIGKIDFSVIAVQKNTDNYGSWTFSTTVAKDTAGATSVIAYSELDAATSGSDAATWDVNINSNAVIYCTGSAGAGIQWYAHVTKKMFLSGSGLITY